MENRKALLTKISIPIIKREYLIKNKRQVKRYVSYNFLENQIDCHTEIINQYYSLNIIISNLIDLRYYWPKIVINDKNTAIPTLGR